MRWILLLFVVSCSSRAPALPDDREALLLVDEKHPYQDPSMGCIKYADGHITQGCRVYLNTPNTAAIVCILDDGTVCLGQCEICVKKFGDEWIEVNGWFYHPTPTDK